MSYISPEQAKEQTCLAFSNQKCIGNHCVQWKSKQSEVVTERIVAEFKISIHSVLKQPDLGHCRRANEKCVQVLNKPRPPEGRVLKEREGG